jgi:hypothetical protein
MSRYQARVFDKNLPVYVRKPVKISGKLLLPGSFFDWKNMTITDRRVRQMFDAGSLQHSFEEDKANEIDADLLVQDDDFEKETVDKRKIEDSEELTSDKEKKLHGYSVRHRGGPWYDVVNAEGKIITEKGLKQSDAISLIERLTDEFEAGDTPTI